MSKDINIDKTVNSLFDELKSLKSNLKSNSFSSEELARFLNNSTKIELELYKAKVNLELDELFQNHPNLTSKEALIQLLGTIPTDAPNNTLVYLAAYILEKWELKSGKLAA